MTDRIPCINPNCRRTAAKAKYRDGTEIVCGKCWRTLPTRLRDDYKALRRKLRKMERHVMKRQAEHSIQPERAAWLLDLAAARCDGNWREIRSFFLKPKAPAGLESFLDEVGL